MAATAFTEGAGALAGPTTNVGKRDLSYTNLGRISASVGKHDFARECVGLSFTNLGIGVVVGHHRVGQEQLTSFARGG